MELFAKQKRQSKRLAKNQTKSTILAVKQYINESNKKLLSGKSGLPISVVLKIISDNKTFLLTFKN